ncbi:B-cell lymphoma 6 protein [Eumeta japonica]|uniref:B-cell lymphoma 6 protein n=1 Tax=Eumeta variegata TaxID=151549 RepID=A0A4C1WFC2_EUMVA|nr:B-cell lymphoma 6 protein [Eumeta japonica]
MEEHHYENSCEESTKEKGRSACCGSAVTKCECKMETANIKLDTLTDGKCEVYKCEHCGYITDEKNHLIKHARTHMAKEPEQLNFKLRKRRRTAEKPYRCDRWERPYGCEQCDYRATHLTTLKAHMRIHTDGTPYNCKYCEYTTFDKERPGELEECTVAQLCGAVRYRRDDRRAPGALVRVTADTTVRAWNAQSIRVLQL